jgi:hypothetical protein
MIWRPLFTLAAFTLALSFSEAAESAGGKVWASLYSTDIPRYAANLRAAGCPEETVGLLISHEINLRFLEKEKALQPSLLSAKTLREEFSPERREALLKLGLEKNAMMRSVLGRVPQEVARFDWTPGELSHLTPQEQETVRMIMEDYNTMIARILVESRGHLIDEDRDKLRFLETEREADLGKFLNQDEMLDFELNVTVYGRSLRAGLVLFNPTQEQLRTCFTLGRKHGLDYESLALNPVRRSQAQAALNAELATLWDAETYARYRRGISGHYAHIVALVARLRLGISTAEEIFASQKQTTEYCYKTYRQRRPASAIPPPPDPGMGQILNAGPITESSSATIKFSHDEIVLATQVHCDLVRSKLGDAGFAEYFELNRRWLEAMRAGGAVQLDYSYN